MGSNKLKISEKQIISTAWILAVLVCVKSIFTDFGADEAYQVAMSYRNLNGDALLLQMWEPHQTSIFLNNILMFLYRLVVPSYKGVVLYLQVCGTLAFAGLAAWYYRITRDVAGTFIAHLMCIYLLVFRVKQNPILHFANMQIGFSVLMLCALVALVNAEKTSGKGSRGAVFYPVLTGVFFFLQVLSYPTCLISGLSVIAIFVIFSRNKWRNSLLFVGGATGSGLVFLVYLLVKVGLSKMLETAGNILGSDTHTAFKMGDYWSGFLTSAASFLCAAVLAVVLYFAVGAIVTPIKKVSFPTFLAICAFVVEVVMILFQRKIGVDPNCSFYIIPVSLIAVGVTQYRKMTEQERFLWLSGTLLSLSSFMAALVLTDLGLITILAYLVLGGAVSFIPCKYLCRDHKAFLCVIMLLILFHRGMVIWGYGNINSRMLLTYESQNIIRSGPGMGLVVDHVTKNQAKMDEYDFDRFTNKDDKVLLIGRELMDPLVFLYPNGEISNYSTIDTPLYNESIEEYIRVNPDKEPTVVAVECWYGNLLVDQNTYIMDWVNEKYEPVGDGDYWRFYRVKGYNGNPEP
jgi:hypothetical protein